MSCIHFPINKVLTGGEKIFSVMKKKSSFPHERKEAEGEEDPFSEEKGPKSPALPHKPILLRNPTNIGRKAEQYWSRRKAILL